MKRLPDTIHPHDVLRNIELHHVPDTSRAGAYRCITAMAKLGVIFLMFATLSRSDSARAQESLSDQTRAQFAAFSAAVGEKPNTVAVLRRAPTWIRASTDDWIFTIDLVGNRTLRPAKTDAFLPSMLRHPVGSSPSKLSIPSETRATLVEKTRLLANTLADVQRDHPDSDESEEKESATEQDQVAVKQELVFVNRLGAAEMECFAGRYLVRLRLSPRRFFQVLFTSDGEPIRIDTNVRDPRTARLADAIANQKADASLKPALKERRVLTVGTFYDPGEYRFELQAYSHEGEPFLDLSQRQDPFGRDNFPLPYMHAVDTAAYRLSKDYYYWCWKWWTRYGRVGAVRGNHGPKTDAWEHKDVRVLFHKNLADYPLVGGEPKEIRKYSKPDKEYEYPYSPHEEFTPRFYADLERCDVVYVSTHGGQLDHRFRFRRNPDVWVAFNPPEGRGLGSGRLRHIFWECCGAMSCVELPDEYVLVETWLHREWIDGVRMICGNDGGHSGRDRSGWRFYGYYNKGDSISEAWTASQHDEYVRNCPVTIGYGETRDAALETLYTDRFNRKRAKPTWAAVSIWANPKNPD